MMGYLFFLSFIGRIFFASFFSKEVYMLVAIGLTRRLQMTVLLFLFKSSALSSIIFFKIFIFSFVIRNFISSFISRIFFAPFFSKKINMFITIGFTGGLQVT